MLTWRRSTRTQTPRSRTRQVLPDEQYHGLGIIYSNKETYCKEKKNVRRFGVKLRVRVRVKERRHSETNSAKKRYSPSIPVPID